MRCKIYYMSQRGSAEAVAAAIAEVADCTPESLLPAYMPENIDLMFLGCEGSRADKVTLDFIATLSPSRVKTAALFHCARVSGEALGQMRAALEARGVTVLADTLSAPLRSSLGFGGPDEASFQKARAFAQACLSSPKIS